VTTIQKLVEALTNAGAPEKMIKKARQGYYDDYASPLVAPISQLVFDAKKYGLGDICQRAIEGDFDGTKEEGDEWFRKMGLSNRRR
jgi:hypothetical protein